MNRSDKKANPITFFTAFLFSAFGFEFIMFIMTVHIYKLTGSPLDVGIFTTLAYLPRIFSQYYGVMIDKYNRKMFFAFSGLAISILSIFMAFTTNIYTIYVLWFLISFFAIVILTSRTAILTDVVRKDTYVQGNAIALTMLNAAKLVGPLIGGLIATTTNIEAIFYFTSVIYFLTFLLVMSLKLPVLIKSAEGDVNTINEHIVEGLRYMFGNHTLRFLVSIVFSWRLFFGLQVSLFVVYVQSYLNLGSPEYGFFMTCVGIGSLLGGFIGLKVAPRVDGYRLMLWGLSFHFLSFTFLGVINSYYVAIVTQIISYALLYMSIVGTHTIRDTAVKAGMRGRVMGSITAIVAPPAIISMIAGSYLAERFGVENVLICAGLLGFLTLHSFYYFFSRRYHMVRLS